MKTYKISENFLKEILKDSEILSTLECEEMLNESKYKKILENINFDEYVLEDIETNENIQDAFEDWEEDIFIQNFEEHLRSKQEIIDYHDEAFDKVWVNRSLLCDYCDQKEITNILNKYSDIPKDGYDELSYGFWCGVLATCRWVLGEEIKDNIDT